jgi:hypothetical protein
LKGVVWDSQLGLRYGLKRNARKLLEVNTPQTIPILFVDVIKISNQGWHFNCPCFPFYVAYSHYIHGFLSKVKYYFTIFSFHKKIQRKYVWTTLIRKMEMESIYIFETIVKVE